MRADIGRGLSDTRCHLMTEPTEPTDAPSSESAAATDARGIRHRARHVMAKKSRQAGRISRTTMRYAVFMCGAAGVALFSLVFAWIAELALRWNAKLTTATPWLAFI